MPHVMTEAEKAAQDAIEQVLARSATDAAFRQQLLSNPRSAIAQASGREVPESFNVRFIENKADATIVLPNFVDAPELSESELEAVSGGTEPISTTVAIIGGAALLIGAIATGVAIGIEAHKSTCDEH